MDQGRSKGSNNASPSLNPNPPSSPSPNDRVILQPEYGFCRDIVLALLQHFYCFPCHTLACDGDVVVQCARAANFLQLGALNLACEAALIDKIDDNVAAFLLQEAIQLNYPTLRAKALGMVLCRMMKRTTSPAIKDGEDDLMLIESGARSPAAEAIPIDYFDHLPMIVRARTIAVYYAMLKLPKYRMQYKGPIYDADGELEIMFMCCVILCVCVCVNIVSFFLSAF